MAKIGLIGGLSYISSLDYYRIINQTIQENMGGQHSAELVLYSMDFHPMSEAMFTENWEFIRKKLSEAVFQLIDMDCVLIAICCNTVHKVFYEVQYDCNFELIHIIQPTINAISKMKLKKVGLLGTKYTMSGDFYKKQADMNGIILLPPEKNTHDRINEIIFSEICHNKLSKSSESFLLEVSTSLINKGCEGIILACTELPRVLTNKNIDTFLFSTTELHAKEIAIRSMERPYVSFIKKHQNNYKIMSKDIYIQNIS